MIPVDFTRPWLLAVLAGLVPVALLARATKLRLTAGRFWTSAVSRAAAVAALALALAGLRFIRISDELAVVFVLDRSRSVTSEEGRAALDWIRETAKAAGPKESTGLVVFGRESSVEVSPAGKFELDKVHSVVSPEGTDLARALRLAVASCPDGSQKRLVVLSDGNENAGDAATEALSVRGRGAEVWAIALGRDDPAEVRIDRVVVPPHLSPKEPYEITAIVTASSDTEATFRVIKNRVPLAPVKRALRKGTWPVTFTSKVEDPEIGAGLDFEVYLAVPEGADTWRENNVGRAHSRVRGPSRILYVEGKEGESESLATCLADAGLDVDVRGPAGAPLSLAEMDAYDAIVLCDVHSRQLSKGQQEALRQYVHDLGGGLVMIGGPASFGAGAWQRTPVEAALPVDMDVRQYKHLASLSVVIIIDSSGSMSARTPDGRTKLDLAADGAAETVRVLNENDEVAVATVDTDPSWLTHRTRVGDRRELLSRIDQIKQGGGGIYCKVGLQAAYDEIDRSEMMTRHVILFADAADAEQHDGCLEIVGQAWREGITVSVIAIGREKDQDVLFLRDVAQAGNGRFYITDDPMELPRIFSEETVAAARSVIVEKDFAAAFVRPGQILEGIDWGTAPALKGYIATVAKPQAEVHLEGPDGDPLLAKWHYGLGKSLAFTSDAKPRWAHDWIAWPGYRTLWPQALRWTMRRGDEQAFAVATTLSGGMAKVSVDALTSAGRFRDFLQLRAFVAGPGGMSADIALRQTGPGRYEAEFPAPETGTWFVTVAEAAAGEWEPRANAAIIIPYPPEYRTSAPNRALLASLAEITGGQLVDLAPVAGLFRHTAAPARRPRELWRELLGFALAALFLDVLARRMGIPDTLRRRRAAAAVAVPAVSPEAAVVDRLRGVKAALPRKDSGIPAPVLPIASASPEAKAPVDEAAYLERLRAAKKRAQK